MRYYLDTEFIEGFREIQASATSTRKSHFIDLISIGIVADDGRVYYAISNEFNPQEADKWVQNNVLEKIIFAYFQMLQPERKKGLDKLFLGMNIFGRIQYVQARTGKCREEIAKEIHDFINPGIKDFIYTYSRHDCWAEVYYPKEFKYIKDHNTKTGQYYSSGDPESLKKNEQLIYNQPEFYAYYADYDWVVFCSLFGRMIDLPKGFPMYCRDLKQRVDEIAKQLPLNLLFEERLKHLKCMPNYPEESKDEHNALADAIWNKKLYEFIEKFKK